MAPGSRLFVYGTLMAPEVMEVLLNRVPAMRPARLEGFERWSLDGAVFPAVRRAAGGRVTGLLVDGLSTDEQAILDWFEDDGYELLPVRVCPLDRPHDGAVDAGVYSWPARRADDPLADLRVGVPWSYEDFRRRHLPAYIESTRAYRDEYESSRNDPK